MLRIMRRKILISLLLCSAVSQAKSRCAGGFQSNLPILSIETQDQALGDDAITALLMVTDNGPGQLNNSLDPIPERNLHKIEINVRGDFSRKFKKKQFLVKFVNDAGKAAPAPLLGFDSFDEWIFSAPFQDKSLIRDPLAYELSHRMNDRWAPGTRHFELLINCEYRGVYILIEGMARYVDLMKPKFEDGGFVVKYEDNEDDGAHFTTHNGTNYSYFYPKPKKLKNRSDKEQILGRIQSTVEAFEDRLLSDQFANPELGYAPLVDMDSFVDFAILQELFNNLDAYRRSHHFHRDEQGRIVMGPVWDFNIGAGNFSLGDADKTRGWRAGRKNHWPVPDDLFWWDRLRKDAHFTSQFKARWQQLRQSALSDSSIDEIIDGYVRLLSEQKAAERNFAKWKILGFPRNHLLLITDPRPWPKTWEGEIEDLRSWMHERTQWMDSNIDSF